MGADGDVLWPSSMHIYFMTTSGFFAEPLTSDLSDSEPAEVSFDRIGFSHSLSAPSGNTIISLNSPAEKRANFHLSYISSYLI